MDECAAETVYYSRNCSGVHGWFYRDDPGALVARELAGPVKFAFGRCTVVIRTDIHGQSPSAVPQRDFEAERRQACLAKLL